MEVTPGKLEASRGLSEMTRATTEPTPVLPEMTQATTEATTSPTHGAPRRAETPSR